MIISSANDYREAARRSVLTFIFHYAYGGSYAEKTLPPRWRKRPRLCLLAKSVVTRSKGF